VIAGGFTAEGKISQVARTGKRLFFEIVTVATPPYFSVKRFWQGHGDC